MFIFQHNITCNNYSFFNYGSHFTVALTIKIAIFFLLCSNSLQFLHYMAVYVTANIYRNRQSCNVGWICVYVYCEGSSASAESSRPYTQIINFSSISFSSSATYSMSECAPASLVSAFLPLLRIFQRFHRLRLRQP